MENNSKRAVRYFLVFDQAFKEEKKASEVLEGWEHKEKIYEVYIILDDTSDAPDQIDLLTNDYSYFRSKELAMEFINDEE
ncbi:hypothetical protein MHH81_20865 [Psychrobacillus sp. FSL H8-0484]|uniref:hypothetical protein n=1 Tax=Psychrobacillus sp. FSL H8-0484 TaxID=2921390 RepID=UPI0030F8B3C4